METDYISREAALKGIFDSANSFLEDEDPAKASTMIYLIATSNAREAVKDIPAADVRPVKEGHWIIHKSELFPAESTIECDQCHAEQPIWIDDNYCPNCGAKMGGAQ